MRLLDAQSTIFNFETWTPELFSRRIFLEGSQSDLKPQNFNFGERLNIKTIKYEIYLY